MLRPWNAATVRASFETELVWDLIRKPHSYGAAACHRLHVKRLARYLSKCDPLKPERKVASWPFLTRVVHTKLSGRRKNSAIAREEAQRWILLAENGCGRTQSTHANELSEFLRAPWSELNMGSWRTNTLKLFRAREWALSPVVSNLAKTWRTQRRILGRAERHLPEDAFRN